MQTIGLTLVCRDHLHFLFFPRASERRVLLIVVSVICVCHTSSHLHIFTLTHSHLHILTSSLSLSHTHLHTHTLTSSFTSSHLHILTSSLSLSSFLSPFSLSFLSFAFLFFLSLGGGWCRRGVTKRQPFRTKRGSMRKN